MIDHHACPLGIGRQRNSRREQAMVVHKCKLEVSEFLELIVPSLDGGNTRPKFLVSRTGQVFLAHPV